MNQTQLWIGKNNLLLEKVEQYLSECFCPNKTRDMCSTCESLRTNQHPNVVWLTPEKGYLTSDIEIIFKKISFSLNTDEQFFFILNKSERLGIICSNKLLKILEEPPRGYNFILLSNNLNAILPTIQSRSLIKPFTSNSEESLHPLLTFFDKTINPVAFDQELRNNALSEHDTMQILDELFGSIDKNDTDKITYIKNAMSHPPQPGGSNLFWKNFYLKYPR